MLNAIKNATGLDLGGWAGADLISDESYNGAPGRVAVVANSGGDVSAPTVAVADGAALWVFSHHLGALAVVFGSGAVVPLPLKRAAQGASLRGVPSQFRYSAGRVMVPNGAGTARLRGGSVLLKPWLSVGGAPPVGCWAPGPHDNPDLDLPRWPDLPMPQAGAFSVSPTGMRTGFDTDSRVPTTMEVNRSPWHAVRATFALDALQRDQLQQFYESAAQPFWYVRPDTMQVCRAWWLDDGDPEDNGLGRGRTTSYGLLLEPA